MKPIKWTEADAKRAEQMGFTMSNGHLSFRIFKAGTRFRTDGEAREWVVACIENKHDHEMFHIQKLSMDRINRLQNTCRKALLLCAGGGA